jgi:hypothetical protein
MYPACQSDGSSTAITQGLSAISPSRFIGQFGSHHHTYDQYQDNANRQQAPQHLISPQADVSPPLGWWTKAPTFHRGFGQIVDITSPHFNELWVMVLQRFKLFPAQETYGGQFIHDCETLASLKTGSFSWLQGVIPPWKEKPKLFFPGEQEI